MIAYGCLGVLFLFIGIKCIAYFSHRKNTPSSEDLDQTLISIINQTGEHHG